MIKKMLVLAALLPLTLSSSWSENARKHTYQTARLADGISAFIASESNTDVVSDNCVAIAGDDGVLAVARPISLPTRDKSSPKSSR
jgi:hypothetical protein